jgi:hypothetical protein
MTVPPTTLVPRGNATAVPASSKTAISAATCRPKSPSITRLPMVRIHLPPAASPQSGYAIRLSAKRVLQERIGCLLKRPVGQPPHEVRRY